MTRAETIVKNYGVFFKAIAKNIGSIYEKEKFVELLSSPSFIEKFL